MRNSFENPVPNGDSNGGSADDSLRNLPGFLNGWSMSNVASFASNIQERIFQRDMTAAMRASMQPPQPVAASHNAIRQLPTVQVSREDLIDPCNRECCICLEGIHLGHSVLRLPCAHVYHPACIQQWLTNHGNTCPVCRYELPVDNNPDYEAGRRERMRCRKPRFAQHELDRLSIAQLKQLLPASQTTRRFAERRELVECLIQSGVIDIVATPEPVQYRLSELRVMSISRLKTAMSDAGVFFDAKEVVEKSDMVHIFIASGRLQLLDEPVEEDRKPAARPGGLTVETVSGDGEFGNAADEREDRSILMEENADFKQSCARVTETQQAESSDSSSSIQLSENNDALSGDTGDFLEAYSLASDRPTRRKRRRHDCGDVKLSDCSEPRRESASEETVPDESGNHLSVNDETESSASAAATNETSSEGSSTIGRNAAQPVERGVFEPDSTDSNQSTSENGSEHEGDTGGAGPSHSQFDFELDRQNIAQLKALARAHSVDLSDCLERTEIICRLTSRLHLDGTRAPRANEPVRQVLSHPLDNWGISEIRALAALSEVDLSNCRSREEMINMLNMTAISRPHVANYFQTLAPLAQLSIPQLRAVARERQIHVLDCIEKGDIIQRLVESMQGN